MSNFTVCSAPKPEEKTRWYVQFEIEWYLKNCKTVLDNSEIEIDDSIAGRNGIAFTEHIPWVREGLYPLSLVLNDAFDAAVSSESSKNSIDWFALSLSPELTCKRALVHDAVEWCWKIVSGKPDVTLDLVLNNPGKPWSWMTLSYHPNIKMETIAETFDELPWDMMGVSQNPNVTLKFFMDHIDWQWNMYALSSHLNFEPEEFTTQLFTDIAWDWRNLSRNRSLTLDVIERFMDLVPWDFVGLSENPNVTISFVRRFIDEEWNWSQLSCNPGISIQDVLSNPDLPWSWFFVTYNPNVTIADVLEHPEKAWYKDHCEFRLLMKQREDYLRERHRRLFTETIAPELMAVVYDVDNYDYVMTYLR